MATGIIPEQGETDCLIIISGRMCNGFREHRGRYLF
jgi:hypothetical protein